MKMSGRSSLSRASSSCTSNPFIPGICTSSRTQSGRSADARSSRNSSPEAKIEVFMPKERTRRWSARHTEASSSIIAIRAGVSLMARRYHGLGEQSLNRSTLHCVKSTSNRPGGYETLVQERGEDGHGTTAPIARPSARLGRNSRRFRHDPDLERHKNQLGHGTNPHLAHDPAAMDLDGLLADAEFRGDPLVGQAADYQHHHFTLARRERRVSFFELRPLGLFRLFFRGPGDGFADGQKQILGLERFGKEVYRTRFHGHDAHGNVTVAGDEDNRQRPRSRAELPLQIETVEPGHLDVEHQAAPRGMLLPVIQEFPRGGEGLHLITGRSQQPDQTLTNGRLS